MEFKKISAFKAEVKKRVKKTESGKAGNVIDVAPQSKSWRGPFNESTAKGAVMTFARMNPPTTGHEKLVNVLKLEAKARGYDPVLVLSSTAGDAKNPLNPQEKLELAREAFPHMGILLAKDFIDALKKVNAHYKNVTIVVGEDRLSKVNSMLKYNGKDFHFDSIKVEVAGARVVASSGVEGMSASKVRAHAHAGQMDHFANGLASGIRHKADIIHKMIREQVDLEEATLDSSGRLAARQRFRRIKARVKLGRERAMKRRASTQVIDKRARRAAKMVMRSRMLGGRKWGDLPLASRAAIDKRLAPRAKAIGRIAKRLAPKLRRAEYSRKIGGGFKGLASLNKKPSKASQMLGTSKSSIKTVGEKNVVAKTVAEALVMVSREYQPHLPDATFAHIFELAFTRGVPVEKLVNEYRMGYAAGGLSESEGFARMHSFLNDGLAARLDELAVPNIEDGKAKRRVDLPQLSDFGAFKNDLSSNGISMKPIMVDPRHLTPTQKHFNEEKVAALKESGWDKHPIIVSNCNHVIDGHHRWLAAHQLGEKIAAQQVGMDVDSLLEFCKDKPYVQRKKLSESVTINKPKTIAEIKAKYKKDC
jgi:hypothetical protein